MYGDPGFDPLKVGAHPLGVEAERMETLVSRRAILIDLIRDVDCCAVKKRSSILSIEQKGDSRVEGTSVVAIFIRDMRS